MYDIEICMYDSTIICIDAYIIMCVIIDIITVQGLETEVYHVIFI